MSVGAKYGRSTRRTGSPSSPIPRPEGLLPATRTKAKGYHAGGSERHRSLRHLRVPATSTARAKKFHGGGVPAEKYEWAPGAVNKGPRRQGSDHPHHRRDAVPRSRRGQDASPKYGVEADVINMPSLVPLDYTDLIASVKNRPRVVWPPTPAQEALSSTRSRRT